MGNKTVINPYLPNPRTSNPRTSNPHLPNPQTPNPRTSNPQLPNPQTPNPLDDREERNILLFGYSRSGKTTLLESICGRNVSHTPETKEVRYFHNVRPSSKYCLNIFDFPGFKPHLRKDYPCEVIFQKINKFIHIIVVTLDITEVRGWLSTYQELRTMLKKIESYCLSQSKIVPTIFLVITKLELTPLELGPFGRTPTQTWFDWKNSLNLEVKEMIWDKVSSIFGELFNKNFTGFVSIVDGLKNNYGVDEIVSQFLDDMLLCRVKFELLYNHIKRNIDCVKRDLYAIDLGKSDSKLVSRVSNKYKKQVTSLIKNIEEELLQLLEPDRPLYIAIIGASSWGKTSVINTLLQKKTIPLKTETPKWVTVDDSLCILDTFGIEASGTYPKTQLTKEIKETRPDVILVVADASKVGHWCGYAPEVRNILDIIQDASNNQISPIICIITKIDIADEGKFRMTAEETFDNWKNRVSQENTIEEVLNYFSGKFNEAFRGYFKPAFLVCTAIQKEESFGVIGPQGLKDLITNCAPINAQIGSNKIDRYIKRRRNLAIKIISGFSALASIVSLVPIVDIVCIKVVADQMLVLLECLSTHPERNAKSFTKAYKISLVVGNVLRGGIFITLAILDLTGIGLAVSIPVGCAIAASSVAGTGAYAYNYFTEDLIDDQ